MMGSTVGGVDLTGMGDVLDLPLLEDIPPLAAPEAYIGEGAAHQIRIAAAPQGAADDSALVKPPSYPSLWGLGIKEDPYAAHILDPGTEEPGNLKLDNQPSKELSFQSSPSPPPEFGLDHTASSVDGHDCSSGNTSLLNGQQPGIGGQPGGRLEGGLIRAGTHGTQGSGSSTDFISLLSIPGVIESMAALDNTGGGQPMDESDWSAFNAPLPLDMDILPKREPDEDDGPPTGPVDFPARLHKSYSSRVGCGGGRGRRTAHVGRAFARGRGRSLIGGQDIDPDMSPEEAKRMRRMLSNRESARRSRHRKQAHLLDLENQVSQLSAEKEQLEEHLQQVAERVRLGDDENSCLRRQVSNLKGKIVKLAAAIRGDGPVPSLEDLEDEDEVLPSSGSSSRMESKMDCNDHPMLGQREDIAGVLRMRRQRIRTYRTGSLERSSKRHSF